MGIAVIINSGAIHKVGLAIDAHGEVTSFARQMKLALPARGFDDSVFDQFAGCGFCLRDRKLANESKEEYGDEVSKVLHCQCE